MIRIRFGLGVASGAFPCPAGYVAKVGSPFCPGPAVKDPAPGRADCVRCKQPSGEILWPAPGVTCPKGYYYYPTGGYTDKNTPPYACDDHHRDPTNSNCTQCLSRPSYAVTWPPDVTPCPTGTKKWSDPRVFSDVCADGSKGVVVAGRPDCYQCGGGGGIVDATPCPAGSTKKSAGIACDHNHPVQEIPGRSDCFRCTPSSGGTDTGGGADTGGGGDTGPQGCPTGWTEESLAVEACPPGTVRVSNGSGCVACARAANCFLPGEQPVACAAPKLLANRGQYTCCVSSVLPPGTPESAAPEAPPVVEEGISTPAKLAFGGLLLAGIIYFVKKGSK